MALAQVQYTQSVAGTQNFAVPFPYISKDHIKVFVDGTPVSFSWTNSTTVYLPSAPVLGAILDIRRETERGVLLVDFQDASTITEKQLDMSARQAFYLAQEAFDATGGSLSVKEDGSYSAAGRRLRDLGAPTSDNDATTKKWVQDTYTQGRDAYAAQLAAEAARDKAKKWADDPENTVVETGKYSAKHHATKAAASAAAAAASAASIVSDELYADQKAAEAAASAAAAATSRTGADTAKTAAEAAKVAAETAKTTAEAASTTAIGARDTTKTYRDTTLTYRDAANTAKTAAETARDTANNHQLNAQTYATNASNSASSASTSMTKAGSWADAAENAQVETGKYSAKHHAIKAAASAVAAANSATASGNSATASANSAAEAAGYAAGLNVPSATGNAGKFLRQKVDETGLEYVSTFTTGMILMWSGLITAIPAGWALCDGLNGTPDLRNRFVVGAGSTYAVGATGGADSVTLSVSEMPGHTHTGTTSSDGHSHTGTTATDAHNHTGTTSTDTHSHTFGTRPGYTGSGGTVSTRDSSATNTQTTSSDSHNHTFTTTTDTHSHTFTTSTYNHTHTFTTASAGGGLAHENRPPYYALALIMKL